MQIYLPIAEITVNVFTIIGIGAAVGFLAGLLGVGGGFLITPLLIFLGVPAAVAVATGANQLIAASFSGALAQWRRGNVDVKLGGVLVAGGALGSVAGVAIIGLLQRLGQTEFVISLLYVVLLGGVGAVMMIESVNAMRKARNGQTSGQRSRAQHVWMHRLPLKMRFQRSKLFVSAIPPFAFGFISGVLAAVMGVGGGFIMVPALIYLVRVPTNVVVGTSLFQIIFVSAAATVLHAAVNHSVDVLLALLLMAGGVAGVQFGATAGQRLRGEQLRALLALLVLAVCFRLFLDLVVTPPDLFSISRVQGAAL
jgi:uncharacterized membrane protein YfcA